MVCATYLDYHKGLTTAELSNTSSSDVSVVATLSPGDVLQAILKEAGDHMTHRHSLLPLLLIHQQGAPL